MKFILVLGSIPALMIAALTGNHESLESPRVPEAPSTEQMWEELKACEWCKESDTHVDIGWEFPLCFAPLVLLAWLPWLGFLARPVHPVRCRHGPC